MNKKQVVDRLLRSMRDASDGPFEPIRNVLIDGVGRGFDLSYRVQGRNGVHPLSELIVSQVADPFERWDLSDVPRFREHFERMLDYLPRSVPCETRDAIMTTTDGIAVPLRHFLPAAQKAPAGSIVVYLHGGAFVLGDETSNDPECAHIACELGCEVVSVGYPLAPEHRFPVPLKAVSEVLEMIAVRGARSLVLCGESAGGNLGAAAILANEEVLAATCGLVTIYPLLDLTLSSPTIDQYATGYFLTKRLLQWSIDHYLPDPSLALSPEVSPLLRDLSHLPPVLAITGEYDPLRGDSERFIEAVPGGELRVFPGMVHGFIQLRGLLSARDTALDQIVAFARGTLERPRRG